MKIISILDWNSTCKEILKKLKVFGFIEAFFNVMFKCKSNKHANTPWYMMYNITYPVTLHGISNTPCVLSYIRHSLTLYVPRITVVLLK